MNISRPQTLFTLLSCILLGLFLSLSPSLAEGASLDAASRECISCHESELKAEMVFHSEGGDHPIGLDYIKLATHNPSLVPSSLLNPALRLDNGRIGCLTCHVPYDKKNHLALSKKRGEMPSIPDPMLTVDNSISGLCIACHQK